MSLNGKLFLHSWEGYFNVVAKQQRGKLKANNTWVSTETVGHKCTYIILFLTQYNGPINDDRKTIFMHRLHMSHMFCLRPADDITIDYKALNDCDKGMWKVMSNSLDIDFINSDIHGQ